MLEEEELRMPNESQDSGQQLLTIGELARHFNVSTHQLKYAVERYKIQPKTRIGIIRVWSADSLPTIKHALERIALNRGHH
jgi:hypothetical protein